MLNDKNVKKFWKIKILVENYERKLNDKRQKYKSTPQNKKLTKY